MHGRPLPQFVLRKPCGNRGCPTGGHKGRPYRHALGFLVGAGFIPARDSPENAKTPHGSLCFRGDFVYHPALKPRRKGSSPWLWVAPPLVTLFTAGRRGARLWRCSMRASRRWRLMYSP